MAEQTFRSPGFFEREIDLTERVNSPSGTPAGVIGSSEKGPAFVPVTVGSFTDFETRFGGLSANRFAPYAVNEWLKNRNSLTFTRTLGAGANKTITDISLTKQYGIVKNAGLVISGTKGVGSTPAGNGYVQFLTAEHAVAPVAENVYPIFRNRSIPDYVSADAKVNLVRGMLLFATGTRGILTGSDVALTADVVDATSGLTNAATTANQFKLIISATDPTYSRDDNLTGVRVFTCSLNPHSTNYYGKVLNTDPFKFQTERHLLYADFAVDAELASGSVGSGVNFTVALTSGTDAAGPSRLSSVNRYGSGAGVKFAELFGRMDTRYTTPRTSDFISQPYGEKEYDLFHFETISDGQFANSKYKVSIANLRASTDPNNPYGTFTVQVRAFDDTDINPQILESFPNCNLNPTSDRYVARIIGDRKVRFNHDAEIAEERRVIVSGRYGNRSLFVRIVMNSAVENNLVPKTALPFGFRGIPTIKTTDSLTDQVGTAITGSTGEVLGDVQARMITNAVTGLTGSIVPPLPYRFKVTRGPLDNTTSELYTGQVGNTTRVDRRFYWGVQNTRFPSGSILDPNIGSALNPVVEAYTKFVGIAGMDTLVTGSGADNFNDNKFTLARVALSESNPSQVTLSADEHMLTSAYLRSAVPTGSNYTVQDNAGTPNTRVTLATLINSSSAVFNRFTAYNKFTNIFYGGFDGLNFLDRETYYMQDRATSVEAGGYAADETARLGLSVGTNGKQAGAGIDNNSIASYRTAVEIMTDPFTVRTNILAIPGIRDPFVTDFAAEKNEEYSLGFYVMDIPSYGIDGTTTTRLFADSEDKVGLRPDAAETAEQFDSRAVDNSFSSTYFPDVTITAPSGRAVDVPASIAAVGALGFNDKVSFPWFAPAGFNRGSLSFVTNTKARLLQEDRDTLQDARINPIATFPVQSSSRLQYVIFGQKTLQQAQSALDRVNVRRMVLDVKRIVSDIARELIFDNIDDSIRQKFVRQTVPRIATIAAQQGIEEFNVICDDSNNTELDEEQNRMNGRIVLVPTRVIEFIAIDFIITSSGVEFA